MYLVQQGEEPGKIQPRRLKGHSVKLMVAKLKANQKRNRCRARCCELRPWRQLGTDHEQLSVLNGGGGQTPKLSSKA